MEGEKTAESRHGPQRPLNINSLYAVSELARWKASGEGLFAVDVAVGILLGISVCAGNAQLREGVAVEVIVGLAVPGAIGGDDSRQQAGSDAVGARHQGLWFGFGDILVRTAGDGRAEHEAEGAGQQQSRTQRLTPRMRVFFFFKLRGAFLTPPQSLNA